MNWIPDDSREPEAGAEAVPGDLEPPDGPTPDRAGGFPDLSPVALVAGVIGLIAGPLLVDDPTARYVILAADVVAIVFGVLGIWTSFKRYARLDYAVAGLIMGGVSLFLWVRYVSDPPQGGT
jgi:hypothetical protein